MSGHGEKLTRKQDAAIGALLSHPTISAAAESVGIGEATLRRWLKDAGFLAAYRAARRDSLEQCIALLQEAGSDAVEALQQSLQANSEGVRLRAACAILDYSMKGAELLDFRDSYQKGQKVVQYRFRQRRLECVVDAVTLRIVDAGVCLDDHRGTKGDTFFTLESLPGVIGEAMDLHKLVVWRHVGDETEPEEERDFEWEDRWD